ncbi:ComF family protein [Flavobacterium sp. 3HN19-14]|uniref:ComF family protein n=1 Tax=Flavobacterium sp. 3HN19-14 TaxID=3448133 RepID=UPI003EE1436E
MLFENLIALFFPKVCSGCHALLLGNENTICTDCRHEIPLTQFHQNPENEGFKKFYGRIPVEFVAAMLYYHKDGIVQSLIHSLKYKGKQEIGTILGDWYAEDLAEIEILKTVDFIIPVPLHKKRLKERGYNQIESFGMALSRNLEIPFNDKILLKRTYSKTQSKKSFLERTDMKEGDFDVDFGESHIGKHFLLIDDVLTTGTTLENCARALLKIPDAKISIVTMAMSHA